MIYLSCSQVFLEYFFLLLLNIFCLLITSIKLNVTKYIMYMQYNCLHPLDLINNLKHEDFFVLWCHLQNLFAGNILSSSENGFLNDFYSFFFNVQVIWINKCAGTNFKNYFPWNGFFGFFVILWSFLIKSFQLFLMFDKFCLLWY